MSAAPGAEAWVPERLSKARIAEGLHACHGCDLVEHATQAVPGAGVLKARLLLVGEQPGDREDLAGVPFVGPAGRVLHDALDRAGIDPVEVFLTNAVKHFRFRARGKRRIHEPPTYGQVVACRPWLLAEVRLLQPAGVVLLGGTAGRSLFGQAFRVGEARGQVAAWPQSLPLTGHAPWVTATIHPSAVLRNDRREETMAGLVDDLRVAVDALG